MNIAIIGCGYVADFYMASLRYHPELVIVGAYDIDSERMAKFCSYYTLPQYSDIDEVMGDQKVEMIWNLTNPKSHYEVTKQSLEAGKHVYSEKPLAMTYKDAQDLSVIAKENEVYLSSAPCSMLGVTAQTIWDALNKNVIGDVRLIYANFDAGMTHQYKPWRWKSVSGAPWPAKDEFEVGCTYEHAGYFLTWLAAFFGPARKVHSFASTLIKDKGIPVDVITPDFALGCIEYDNGIIARVTTSIVAPLDKSLMIMGDRGVIYTKDLRDDAAPVYVQKIPPGRLEAALGYRMEFYINILERRSEERRVGKECRSRWSPYH